MSDTLKTPRRLRRIASLAVVAPIATLTLAAPFAGAANAAVTAITAQTNQATYNAGDTPTISSLLQGGAPSHLFYVITSGPDAGNKGALANSGAATPLSAALGNTGGTDTIQVFDDVDNSMSVTSGDVLASPISITVIGAAVGFTLDTPNGAAVTAGTCLPFTAGVVDSTGKQLVSKKFIITATEPGATLSFCDPAVDTIVVPASNLAGPGPSPLSIGTPGMPATAVATTTATGKAGDFGIRSNLVGTTVLKLSDVAGVTDLTRSIGVVTGGGNAVSALTATPNATSFVAGESPSFAITVADAVGRPVAGVVPQVLITGANGASITAPATDDFGKSTFTYGPAAAGTDVVKFFIDKTSAGHTAGVFDSDEQTVSSTLTFAAPPTGLAVDLTTPTALAAGDTTGETATVAKTATLAPQTFTAKVLSAIGTPRGGVAVGFTSTGAATDRTLSVTRGISDSNGIVTTVLTPKAGTALTTFTVTATILGQVAGATDLQPGVNDTPFVAVKSDDGSVTYATPVATTLTISPTAVTTQVRTAQTFTSKLVDQFGGAVAGSAVHFTVAGRNTGSTTPDPLTDATGVASFIAQDNGSATALTGGNDTVTATAGIFVPAATATRTYTLTPPTAAALEGDATEAGADTQFSGVNGAVAKTDDDTATYTISTAVPITGQVHKVYFQIRNADNTSNLPGKAITVTSSGVGSITNAAGAAVASPVTALVGNVGGNPAFATFFVASTTAGTQTLTATVDGLSKTITVVYAADTTKARAVQVAPVTGNALVGNDFTVTATVVDAFGNGLSGQPVTFTATGATLPGGASSVPATTDATGKASVKLNSASAGVAKVTATILSTAETLMAAGTPAGSIAGASSAVSTVTVAAAADAAHSSLTATPATQVVNNVVTAAASIKDINGNPVVGQGVRFTITGATSAVSGILPTDASGAASFPFVSSAAGLVTVALDVVNSSGVASFSKTTTVTFTGGQVVVGKPSLSQSSKNGIVTLTVVTDKSLEGKVVYFFRKSGITGKVVPLGTGTVDSNGVAQRTFNSAKGGILALYGKVTGVSLSVLPEPYTNTIAFKVQ